MVKLKPCPFCGGKDIRVGVGEGGLGIVYCGDCFAQVEEWVDDPGFESSAVDVWNTRVRPKATFCPFCGQAIDWSEE